MLILLLVVIIIIVVLPNRLLSRQAGRRLHANASTGIAGLWLLVVLLLVVLLDSRVTPAVGQVVVHDLPPLPLSLHAAGARPNHEVLPILLLLKTYFL